MLKGFEYRIYPTKYQEELIQKTFGCCRFVYNQALDFRIKQYKLGNKVNYNSTSSLLAELKSSEEFQWLNEVDSIALQQSLRDLDRAYQNFFKAHSGFPKFKTKHNNHKSFRSQNVNNNIRIANNKLKFPKLGLLKIKYSREINGEIKNASIKQTPSGKYFVSIIAEVKSPNLQNYGCIVGIDVGLKKFYTDSNGNTVNNPKYLNKSQKKLARLQKQLAKKQQASANREKARIKVARLHEKIVNQRNDFLHKESTKLVRENQIIGIEDLNVRGLTKNHKLARSINDVSWNKFYSMLNYKARIYNSQVVKVGRFFASSQTCNCCKNKFPITKDLGVRFWTCPMCGSENDRDINAAKNILDEALRLI